MINCTPNMVAMESILCGKQLQRHSIKLHYRAFPAISSERRRVPTTRATSTSSRHDSLPPLSSPSTTGRLTAASAKAFPRIIGRKDYSCRSQQTKLCRPPSRSTSPSNSNSVIVIRLTWVSLPCTLDAAECCHWVP